MTSEKKVSILGWTTLALVVAFGIILFVVRQEYRGFIEELKSVHQIELAQAATDGFLLAQCEDLASCDLRIKVAPDTQMEGDQYVVTAGIVVRAGINGAKGEKTVLPKECTGTGDATGYDGFPAGSQNELAKCFVLPEQVAPLVAQ